MSRFSSPDRPDGNETFYGGLKFYRSFARGDTIVIWNSKSIISINRMSTDVYISLAAGDLYELETKQRVCGQTRFKKQATVVVIYFE